MTETEYQGRSAHTLKAENGAAYKNGAHLKIQTLSKAFGDFQVLKEINLEVTPGEFVAFVGKSGCGKTTLLRLLGGLDEPTQGQIYQNGDVLQGLNRDARVMFQDSRLLPWRRVLDNVSLGLKHQAQQQGQWALEQVGLGDRANHWITQLSGGQRQRVALARALVSQPRLLLLDEPLGALDALTRVGMQHLIETLWQEQGFTALLVTHDVEEAVYLADRVIVIEEGKITLNLPITLPRPRDVASVQFAELKSRILDRILNRQRPQASELAQAVPVLAT
jgi:sulfonate transport system ATP-binding protein